MAVHLLAYLRQDGYSLPAAAAAAGALGVVQVAGRVVLTASARRMPAAVATALLLGAQAGGVAALLLIGGPAGVALFVLLFGAGFGVLSIARPDLLARYAPRRLFARVSGIQALLVIVGEAAGPTAAAALRAATGSYTPVVIAVAGCSLAAALLILAADRAHRQALYPGVTPSQAADIIVPHHQGHAGPAHGHAARDGAAAPAGRRPGPGQPP